MGMDDHAVKNLALGWVKEDQPDPDKDSSVKVFSARKMREIGRALQVNDAEILAALPPSLPPKRACSGRDA